MRTIAPFTCAPLGSETMPDTLPVVVWPDRTAANPDKSTNRGSRQYRSERVSKASVIMCFSWDRNFKVARDVSPPDLLRLDRHGVGRRGKLHDGGQLQKQATYETA